MACEQSRIVQTSSSWCVFDRCTIFIAEHKFVIININKKRRHGSFLLHPSMCNNGSTQTQREQHLSAHIGRRQTGLMIYEINNGCSNFFTWPAALNYFSCLQYNLQLSRGCWSFKLKLRLMFSTDMLLHVPSSQLGGVLPVAATIHLALLQC